MQPRVMVTNGGTHPAEKHAEISSWKILDLVRIPTEPVAADNPDRATIEAGREAARQAKVLLEPQLTAAFLPHHRTNQNAERTALKTEGDKRDAKPRRHAGHVDEAAVLAEINGILAGSIFAEHFAGAAAQARLTEIIGDEFERAVGDERGWDQSQRKGKGKGKGAQ